MTAPTRRWDWQRHCTNAACRWVILRHHDGRQWIVAGLFSSAYWAGEWQRTHSEGATDA
jgi:hypothetical protein